MSLSCKVLRRTWEDPQGCPEVSEMDLVGRCYDRWTDCKAQMGDRRQRKCFRKNKRSSLEGVELTCKGEVEGKGKMLKDVAQAEL